MTLLQKVQKISCMVSQLPTHQNIWNNHNGIQDHDGAPEGTKNPCTVSQLHTHSTMTKIISRMTPKY